MTSGGRGFVYIYRSLPESKFGTYLASWSTSLTQLLGILSCPMPQSRVKRSMVLLLCTSVQCISRTMLLMAPYRTSELLPSFEIPYTPSQLWKALQRGDIAWSQAAATDRIAPGEGYFIVLCGRPNVAGQVACSSSCSSLVSNCGNSNAFVDCNVYA